MRVARDDFATWLGTPVIQVSLRHQHDQWYACADDFGIAGVGASEAAAYAHVAALVERYLRSYYAEGRTFEEALSARRRPDPSPLAPAAKLIGRLLPRLEVRWSAARKRELVLPSSLHVGPSH